ncbi:conserved protein of unknown function (plasmid) [Pararobbsia alpina]
MQSPFAKLTKAVVIFVTAFYGNVNATVPNRILDEALQVNSSDSPVAGKSERRSGGRVRAVVAVSHSHREEAMSRRRAWQALADDNREFLNPSSEHYLMPHTLFGAGSIALSALGDGAPVFVARS